MNKSLHASRGFSIALMLVVTSLACSITSPTASPTAPPLTAAPSSIPVQVTSTEAPSAVPSQAPTEIPTETQLAPAMVPGDYDLTFDTGGLPRNYILHVPVNYDGSHALPLVFVLHGLGGSAQEMVKSTGPSKLADQGGVLVAYLQGTGDPPGFNSGLLPELGLTVDDVDFVRQLLANLESQLQVDSQRVYAAGFSNGAFMAYRLAAQLSDKLAAVAIVEGTIGLRQPDGSFVKIPQPIGPIAMVIFHGQKDPNLPYDGGQGKVSFALSVADAVSLWVTADSCTGSPQTQPAVNGNSITDYVNCAAGTEVLLFTLPNGVHQWPTLETPAKLPASMAIWKFFSRHSLAAH